MTSRNRARMVFVLGALGFALLYLRSSGDRESPTSSSSPSTTRTTGSARSADTRSPRHPTSTASPPAERSSSTPTARAPLRNPSRTSLDAQPPPDHDRDLRGLPPLRFRTLDARKDRVALPQHFKANGYRTLTVGKIYHGGVGGPEAPREGVRRLGSSGGGGTRRGSPSENSSRRRRWGTTP